MISRRDFLQAATVLGSSSVAFGNLGEIIARVAEINPAEGTTFLDAEHVVVLMQENRSFDHAYGALAGVRGFRDPRPHQLPNGNPVWFQPTGDGKAIPPFRLEMDGSNVTWIGGTPHSWTDQVDARNNGRYDNWLNAKRRSDKFPMTMGFFTREDIPFYYALADAFTICDQAFCSSLTGTTPNRLYLWTGTIREDASKPARVSNGDTDYEDEASWTTFPERLEQAGVSWRIYQNELSINTGLIGDQDSWLSNFTDNAIEWMSQYKVRFLETRRNHVKFMAGTHIKQISEMEAQLKVGGLTETERSDLNSKIEKQKKSLAEAQAEMATYNDESWKALPKNEKAIHQKAFCTNTGDKDYRTISTHEYMDGETPRRISVPKGDVLYQFRTDVESGRLPAVSWLVAPERFSDHPGSAWFGAWYLSEALNILSKDPEVWKKTVFILCYDENDGFFDHVPPFIAPHPNRPETGKTSDGIDTSVDVSNAYGRDHSIGLGYRCPLVVVSPWTRGGYVNSQVCDHTSVIMFIESWLSGKGTKVIEPNISAWRRTVCGDLVSAFRPYNGEALSTPTFLVRDENVERIHKASFKQRPVPGATLESSEIAQFQIGGFQERGTKPSNALPYRIEASLELVGNEVVVTMESKGDCGCPFNVYNYRPEMMARAYAVKHGDVLVDRLIVDSDTYVRVDGPNGFIRQIKGTGVPIFSAKGRARGGGFDLELHNNSSQQIVISVHDESYGDKEVNVSLIAGQSRTLRLSTDSGKRWYDFIAKSGEYSYRFAGRIETGEVGISDPAMA